MSRPLEPRPLRQRRLKTVFLRCPHMTWPLVVTGQVTEFRAAAGNVPQLGDVPLPTFAMLYRRRHHDNAWDYRLMLLEGVRQEALGTVTDEGLRRAGYTGANAFARFRRDWMLAHHRRFEPLRSVFVYTVRPIESHDWARVGQSLTEHLYGEFEDAIERVRVIQPAAA